MKFFILILFLFLVMPLAALAQTEEGSEEEITCPPEPSTPSCSDSWVETEYQCLGSCGGALQNRTRTCWWDEGKPTPTEDENGCIVGYKGCAGPHTSGCDKWSSWATIEACLAVKTCQVSPPSCACSGSCYPAPKLIPLNKTEKNVFDTEDKVKLPLKLDWEDLDPSPCFVGSYRYQIKSEGGEIIENYVPQSEVEIKNCRLKSGTKYSWRVQACLNTDGTDCGAWSNSQNFTTGLAPEPLSPYDEDWEGPGKTENTPLPITLDWCDVKEAAAYRLQIYLLREEKTSCHPWLQDGDDCQSLLLSPKESEGKTKWILSSNFEDKRGYFTKDTSYQWSVGTELKTGETIFGQLWRFLGSGKLPDFNLIFPPDDPTGRQPVGLPLVLDWESKPGINSFIYEVLTLLNNLSITKDDTVGSEKMLDYPQLSLNANYQWKIWPCQDYAGKECEEKFKGPYYFKTTGRPPQQLSKPSADQPEVTIPVNFLWEEVPGAKSYVLNIWGDGLDLEKPVEEKSEFSLDFPEYNVRQEKNYSWQVKTCAWEQGQVCGEYSQPQTFKTFRLPAPTGPSPSDGNELLTENRQLAWDSVPGAKAYQYTIKYLSLGPEEKDQSCSALVGKELVSNKTTSFNFDDHQLNCLGSYQWQARACLDKDCQEVGEQNEPAWSFEFAQAAGLSRKAGLIPCGKTFDDPETPWKERDPCQIKHIFLLLKILLDFAFGRLLPLVLVFLAVASGVIFYFSASAGQTSPLTRVISLWRSAGIGILILFSAWFIVNLIARFLGYKIGIFNI